MKDGHRSCYIRNFMQLRKENCDDHPSFNYKQDCRTTHKQAVFKLFNFYSYIIFGVGGRGVVKIQPRSQGSLLPALRSERESYSFYLSARVE